MTSPLTDYATLPLPLTPVEKEQLSDYEATITRGLNTFYQVGTALVEIKQRKLYRSQYRTFEEYCKDRWQMDRSYAYRVIEASEVRSNLSPIGNKLPETESQARELKGLEPDQQRQVWQKAVETAPNGKVTAQHIKDVRQQEIPMPAPKETPQAAPVHQVSVFIPPPPYESKTCDFCKKRFPLGLNSLPDGGHICNSCFDHLPMESKPVRGYGNCAKCGTRLTGPGTSWFDGKHHDTERICDACLPAYETSYKKDMQRDPVDHALHAELEADDEPEEREPEIEEKILAVYEQIEEESRIDPDEREPEAVQDDDWELKQAYCDFCKQAYPNDHLYGDQFGICRACASKALHELLDPHDPDVLADAALQEAHFHCSDRDKIMQAGLRLFRAIDEEYKPGQRVRELKEYTPTGAKDGNPLMGSWKRVDTFPTTAALKRRIAELEPDKCCIFESRV